MQKKVGFLSHLDLNLYLFRAPIMRELIKLDHKVYAICPKGDKNRALKEIGCEVVNYDIQRESINPFKEKQAIDNIYHAISDLNLDMIHTFTAKPNIYGTFAAKKANIPIILNLVEGLGSFYVHNTLKNILIRNIMEKMYKKAFSMSDGCVFVNSDDPKYMMQKHIIKKEKVKIIKSVGVDTKRFDINNFTSENITSKKREIDIENKIIILMIARAIWDKGIKEFYESAKILKQKYKDIEFILIGPTDEGNHTCASKEYLQNGEVKWIGLRDDIPDLIAISNIFVLPTSYREGLPATLMEAASMNKPIVTTDTVGCRDVVKDGCNGFLVPVKDSRTLAHKIEKLILDENLRKEFGKNGRKIAKELFDIDKIVKQYMDYYREKGLFDV